MKYNKNELTRQNGAVVDNDSESMTTEHPKYTVVNDLQLQEKLQHFNRERIPERVVHAKGVGSYGYFELERDMSQYTCADVFRGVGKRTDIFTRISTVIGERGSADTVRDPRGFAIRFFTNEGNYDLVANNTPVFFIRDAIKFPDLVHSLKKDPVTNLPNPNSIWDFWSLNPISMNELMRLFDEEGIPDGLRHMNAHGIHTFMWYKEDGSYCWVKYHLISRQGIKNLSNAQATKLAGENPDYAFTDMYDAIKKGDFPSWDVCVQILTPEQAEKYKYNIFDISKIIYEEDYPYIKIGKIVLNKLPKNYFNEVEQAAFSPGNFVTGIYTSPDKMLSARVFSYNDAQHYRIGANFHQLPINMPDKGIDNYFRDGAMSNYPKGSPFPSYYPNSFGGPSPNWRVAPPDVKIKGKIGRFAEPVTAIDYEQPRKYYKDLSTKQRKDFIANFCGFLGLSFKNIQYRQCAVCYLTDHDFGTKVADCLKLNMNEVKYLAGLSDEERFQKTKMTR